MKKILPVITLGLLTASGASFAADTSGPYIGAGIGVGIFSAGDYADDLGSGDPKSSGVAYNVYTGYMFNRIVGVELGYNDYSTSTYDKNDIKTKPTSISLAANLGYTFDNGLRPFALIGLSSTNLHQTGNALILDKDNTAALHYGLGLDYTPASLSGVGFRIAYQIDAFSVDSDINIKNGKLKKTSYTMGAGMAYAAVSYHF
ncbi:MULTISPECIES: porin family protein [Vibrio]|uniref:Outer membrane beta-barrel protein n=1 Tax=Vibrio algicola TaxID=2662262 RepID=A0A5Q0TC18_9VIBR|nr:MULTISPECIES: porin family protein [Vibrio]MBD1576226.1 porin family protein [Vibrio sp. S11_S32]